MDGAAQNPETLNGLRSGAASTRRDNHGLRFAPSGLGNLLSRSVWWRANLFCKDSYAASRLLDLGHVI